MNTVDRAVMTIGGETVPQSVWLFEYWEDSHQEGADKYHYSVTYTLTVTDDLLESLTER